MNIFIKMAQASYKNSSNIKKYEEYLFLKISNISAQKWLISYFVAIIIDSSLYKDGWMDV